MSLEQKKLLHCPICEYKSESFRDYTGEYYILGELKDHHTKNAICPNCNSDMRHRFVFKFLTDYTKFYTKPLKLLHFAPEKWLATKIGRLNNIDYVPVDLSPFNFDYMDVQFADITNLPFENNTFDALIMVHVLEHIPDDTKAIKEIHRVLKTGGWAVIAVPTIGNDTHCLPNLSAEERKSMYGIEEHYRLYGTDLADKLTTSGLNTKVIEFSDIDCDFADLNQSSLHIDSDKYIFYCTKGSTPAFSKENKTLATPETRQSLLSNKNIDRPTPRLSVITVTYNAEDYLEKTLLSIIRQTYHDFEIIVIDGKSTDKTIDIIKQYDDEIIYWLSEDDNGIYDAMNKGLQAAKGQYVQFLNAGDYYCDNDVLKDIFCNTSNMPSLIYGDINILRIDNKISYQKAGDFSLNELLAKGTGVVCHQAMFVRRDIAKPYDCSFKYKAELNWYFDIIESKDFTATHVNRPVVYYSLGGFGYQNFISNRLEWVWLIFRRFGLIILLRSKIILFLLKNSLSRYPALNNLVKLIKKPSLIFTKKQLHSKHLDIFSMSILHKLKTLMTSNEFSKQATDNQTCSPSCMNRLINMKKIGFNPKVIFDCGASVGHWSWEVGKLFSNAKILAIEPNPKVTPKTKELLAKLPSSPIVEECAIGSEDGEAFLNVWDNAETKMSGSSLKDHVQGDAREKVCVQLKTLDTLCNEHNLQPDLVKLDLQGYELNALKGASNVLNKAEAFIIEFGCLEAYIDRTTPDDLIRLMYDNNFCLYDIVDLIYRPYDNALTGGDFFFVKNDSKLKEHKGYK